MQTQPLLQRQIGDNTRGKVPKCLYSRAAPAVSTVFEVLTLGFFFFFQVRRFDIFQALTLRPVTCCAF